MDIAEKNLEDAIEHALISSSTQGTAAHAGNSVYDARTGYTASRQGDYLKRTSDHYDKARCLLPDDTLSFILATQPVMWKKYVEQHSSEAEAERTFFDRLTKELANQRRGTLDVLREGIKANGCHFHLAYFRPSNGMNPDIQRRYAGNIFSLVRQLHYSNTMPRLSLDIAIFLNGLPIFTAELKNNLTGQTAAQNAIQQYKEDRNSKEPLFAFGRCLAHFAVDPNEVYVTTRLDDDKTVFLPFNKGRNGGKGNPVAYKGFASAYLWEEIWARDSVLSLIRDFILMVDVEDDKGKKTNERRLLFPRYHQLDGVRRLLAHAREHGPGQRYLIQHSAGSGKSNSIAWLAHQLSTLFRLEGQEERRVFDSIIVITDRRILDKQLQRTVRQTQLTQGVVETIDKDSNQLRKALKDSKNIIVTTLQKFPHVAKDMADLKGKRFAVIIDEAHSSQSGSGTDGLKKVLAVGTLEEAAQEEDDGEGGMQGQGEDMEDVIVREVKIRGRLPNVSYFAFTATPKQKTLELFGTPLATGGYEPFSLYTMRQAIEEGFILDVLQNYITLKAYWSLLKKAESDPHYDTRKAAAVLRNFVELNEHTIDKKIAIIVDHFVNQSAERIHGKAKAMIVTRSRLHAVLYKLRMDAYLKQHGYPYKSLVAFSGTVKHNKDGKEYTESDMNGVSESQTAETFKRDEYRFLIVANKFQTGFDQPLLHSMYVDKKLGGVNAVQTLSRLNRTAPHKYETMVLDFANDAEKIQQSFEPYYERTFLTEGTDPNLLYDVQTRLEDFAFYRQEEVTTFGNTFYAGKETEDVLHNLLEPAIARYSEGSTEEQSDFRSQLTDYLRLYSFLVQIIRFVDTDLERLYVFCKYLLRALPVPLGEYPEDILQFVDLDSYRVQQTSNGRIALARQKGEIEPMRTKQTHLPAADDMELLSQIVKMLNEHFGLNLTEEDKVSIRDLEGRLDDSEALKASVRANTSRENVRLTFMQEAERVLQGMLDSNIKFYKQANDNPEFQKVFYDILFDRYMKKAKSA